MRMIINKNRYLVLYAAVASAMLGCSASAFADSSALVVDNNQNSTYTCTPEELEVYIKESTTSLFAKPDIPNAKQFTAAKASGAGSEDGESTDDCLTLFSDLSVMDDFQKALTLIQDFSLPAMPSMDAITVAAQVLAKKMANMAMSSVCNALTKEAAVGVINNIMDKKVGFDMGDVKDFDHKKYARDLATKHAKSILDKKGIDNRWLDESRYGDIIDDQVESQKNKVVNSIF